MKNVIIQKDQYIDNSVRVNYYEKDFSFKRKKLIIDDETEELLENEVTLTKNRLLFCERLVWIDNEQELDNLIEQHRKEWELKINS